MGGCMSGWVDGREWVGGCSSAWLDQWWQEAGQRGVFSGLVQYPQKDLGAGPISYEVRKVCKKRALKICGT